MKLLFQSFSSYALAFLASLLRPFLQAELANLSRYLVGDVPQLGSTWVAYFADPCSGKRSRLGALDTTLEQFGCFVRGTGHVQGEPADPFEYRGIIKRNVFYGTFRRKDSHILAGTGTFVLKISADTKSLSGHCTWFDNDLNDVWSSGYVWERKGL